MKTVFARNMVSGQLYTDGERVVNLHWIENDHAIVSSPGELDMQSQWGIPVGTLLAEVPRETAEDKCPLCGDPIEPTNNPDNPEVRKWSHWCSDHRCGWMGNYKP